MGENHMMDLAAADEYHEGVCLALIASFACVFVLLVGTGIGAPYGRYSTTSYGPRVPGVFDWIGHSGSLFVLVPLWMDAKRECSESPVNRMLLLFFCLHYINRSFIFGLRVRDPKPIPLFILSQTFGFCCFNGWLQGRS